MSSDGSTPGAAGAAARAGAGAGGAGAASGSDPLTGHPWSADGWEEFRKASQAMTVRCGLLKFAVTEQVLRWRCILVAHIPDLLPCPWC